MINLPDQLCTGCETCVMVCPVNCISMKFDTEGFLRPLVNTDICIHCLKCEKFCPVLKEKKAQTPIDVFAFSNHDLNIRKASSSGGMFYTLANLIIKKGGVVFATRFDKDFLIEHACACTHEDLTSFLGSKYLQSHIGAVYKEAKKHLKNQNAVMFCGTPCQIAGLNSYLNKDYPLLLTVEIFCHGVPSSFVWKDYLRQIIPDNVKISSISFRAKTTGWRDYSFVVKGERSGMPFLFEEKARKNSYMKGYLAGLYSRPSCHYCPFRSGRSGADLSLGDFWGIQDISSEKDDNQGISLVLAWTGKGRSKIPTTAIAVPFKETLESPKRGMWKYTAPPHSMRAYFFSRRKTRSLRSLVNQLTSKNLFYRIINFFIRKFIQ